MKRQSILQNFPKFDTYSFVYPPRPEFKIPASELDKFDTGEYMAQPKYNGSAAVMATNGKEVHLNNRHGVALSRPDMTIEFAKLAKTKKWFVYCGEYLNKGKIGESGTKERHRFIIWDVLVWDGKHLIGSTFEERQTLLETFLPCRRASVGDSLEMYDHLCCTQFKGIYKAPTYLDKFTDLYHDIVTTDLYEGLVLKKRTAKLDYGYQEVNNSDWQLKCRKETKNYKF